MATNAELTADILALDPNAETDGLVKADLEALLLSLTAEPEPVVIKVAKGKSLTSKSGIKAGGDVVTAADFNGGQKTVDYLVERGYLV